MKQQKPLIRRTFLQERFMILMEIKQKGLASLDELTELDDLINRDPKLRHIILEEMDETDPPADPNRTTPAHIIQTSNQTFLRRLAGFLSNWFHFTGHSLRIASGLS